MDYTTKLAYQSNYWYNDGLKRANIRDLTGAITSLKKSLQYDNAVFLFMSPKDIYKLEDLVIKEKEKA